MARLMGNNNLTVTRLLLYWLCFIVLLVSFSSRSANAKDIKILTYNVQIRPIFDEVSVSRRYKHFIKVLPGYDIVVLNEVFINKYAKLIKTQMRRHYPYSTQKLGSFLGKKNGGVYIFSKTPFIQQKRRFFGSTCHFEDCLSDKGVVYIKTKIGSTLLNVFATHLQAHNEKIKREIRLKQVDIINQFINKQKIKRQELVIIAGDLNIPEASSDYQIMLKRLDAKAPVYQGLPFSKDTELNSIGDGHEQARLDYILVKHSHFIPLLRTNRVFAPKPDGSDHFPVDGLFSTVPVAVITPIIAY